MCLQRNSKTPMEKVEDTAPIFGFIIKFQNEVNYIIKVLHIKAFITLYNSNSVIKGILEPL